MERYTYFDWKELLKIVRKHYSTCQKLLDEQLVQDKALSLAAQNLQTHSSSAIETFHAFNEHAQKEFSKHTALLQSFPADLNTLNQIPIHSSIVAESKKLDDFVPKDKLFAWVNRCQMAHEHLMVKTSQLVETMQDIKLGSDSDALKMTGIDIPKLQNLLNSVKEVIQKVEARQINFERDAIKVENVCRELQTYSDANSQKFQAIEHLYRIHLDEYIPEITQYDRYVRETVVYFSDSKVHLTQVLKGRLQTISHYQSLIASVIPTITALSNALNIQSEALLQLLHVHRMAPAWGAALVEIVRRKEYVRVFLKKAKEMADILSQFRSNEERRRETFKNEIARYIPNGLISGLDDPPPYCEISVSNTKDTLPNLVLEDITGDGISNLVFENLVSAIRNSQITHEGSVGSDSISKLQATMLKMVPQVDNIAVDFEKIVTKSNLTDRARKLEEENKKLKQQLSASRMGDIVSPIDQKVPNKGSEQLNHYRKQEDTIKIYEDRIKSLELLLQENYHKSQDDPLDLAKQTQLENALEKEKTKSNTLQQQINQLMQENKKLNTQLEQEQSKSATALSEKKELESLYIASLRNNENLNNTLNDIRNEKEQQKKLLFEVTTHLSSCLNTLKSTDDSVVHFDSILIPDSIHADNLRQLMRKVEDDVISQMALLASYKASLSDSVGASNEAQTVANEIVTLLQKINDLENQLRENEVELTRVQAHEAVLEAECNSVNILLEKKSEIEVKQKEELTALISEITAQKESIEKFEAKVTELEDSLHESKNNNADLEKKLQEQHFKVVNNPEVNALQTLVHEKDSKLIAYKNAVEDWAIVARLCIEQFEIQYTQWNALDSLLKSPSNAYKLKFSDVLDIDIETFPEDLDQYLTATNSLMKSIYDKAMQISSVSPANTITEFKESYNFFKTEIYRRISFQRQVRVNCRFQPNDLCLFVPTKNPKVWAAFHVDSPNYFLDISSHNGFQSRYKKREWILAFLIKVDSQTAGDSDDSYGLAKGTKYYICSAKPWL
ncbi:hypothetical protein HK103_007225 [Boothiomyces macroporosus]|uniref:Autophagy-related protein 11 n=1 Tax=Boothiomyces macroporosus TaxID=261099 RepID=A0AAD5UCP6_9FUNG|nr:hypothetical protein HK103_007225 [Boothiomyces macroporosus]